MTEGEYLAREPRSKAAGEGARPTLKVDFF